MSSRYRLALFLGLLGSALQAAPNFDQALSLFQAKRYPEARAAFKDIATTEAQNAEARYYLGVLAGRRGDNSEAIRRLEEATALNPRNSKYFLELGGAYGDAAAKAGLFAKLEFAHKCQHALETAVQLDPDSLEARNGLVSFYRSAPPFAGGGMSKAYEQAEEIRKRDALMGASVLGQLYLSEKKIDQAFALYEETIKSHPDSYTLLYAIGRAAAQTGQHLDRGEQVLRRCLELTPGKNDPGYAPVHWRLGNIAERRGQVAVARAAYEAALKADPGFHQAREALAKLK
ncbi:MAG: tetratricopeptide repeat protein [Verrucomicrobia bacterium]|nr:tetratricopeptide repeat protein [Verrucomicrobiota bacterium]